MKPTFSTEALTAAAQRESSAQRRLPSVDAGQADAQAFASAMQSVGSVGAGAGAVTSRWSAPAALARLDRSNRGLERGLATLSHGHMSLPETLAFTGKVQDHILATQLVSKVVGKGTQTIDQLTKLQ
jgi:L-aminopeptidase/D-esterase-like protein